MKENNSRESGPDKLDIFEFLSTILGISARREEKISQAKLERAILQSNLLRERFHKSPTMQVDLTSLTDSYNIMEYKTSFPWNSESLLPEIVVEFTDPQKMRQTLLSKELRPHEMEIDDGGQDDCGKYGLISFKAGVIENTPVIFRYTNYISGPFGVLNRDYDDWKSFGYREDKNANLDFDTQLWKIRPQKS